MKSLVILALFGVIYYGNAQVCDRAGAFSSCKADCVQNEEEVLDDNLCEKKRPKTPVCCKVLCAGPGSLCLQAGAVCPAGTVGAIASIPCPNAGVCCQGPPAPPGWPIDYPWPPVQWPENFVFPIGWIQRYEYLPYYFPKPPQTIWPSGVKPLPIASPDDEEESEQPEQPAEQPEQPAQEEQTEDQTEAPQQPAETPEQQPEAPQQPAQQPDQDAAGQDDGAQQPAQQPAGQDAEEDDGAQEPAQQDPAPQQPAPQQPAPQQPAPQQPAGQDPVQPAVDEDDDDEKKDKKVSYKKKGRKHGKKTNKKKKSKGKKEEASLNQRLNLLTANVRFNGHLY